MAEEKKTAEPEIVKEERSKGQILAEITQKYKGRPLRELFKEFNSYNKEETEEVKKYCTSVITRYSRLDDQDRSRVRNYFIKTSLLLVGIGMMSSFVRDPKQTQPWIKAFRKSFFGRLLMVRQGVLVISIAPLIMFTQGLPLVLELGLKYYHINKVFANDVPQLSFEPTPEFLKNHSRNKTINSSSNETFENPILKPKSKDNSQ